MAENKQDSEAENSATASAAKSAREKSDAEHGDSVKETLNKAKDAAGHAATEVVGQAKDKAVSLIGEQKSNLAAGINAVAEGIRQIGDNLQTGENGEKNQVAAFAGQYSNSLAEQVERVSNYVEDRDFAEIARDAEQLARRNPALFVAGAFTLGVLAARFLKSSSSRSTNKSRRLDFSSGKSASEKTAVQAS